MRRRRHCFAKRDADEEKEYRIEIFNMNTFPESAAEKTQNETQVTLLCKAGVPMRKNSTDI